MLGYREVGSDYCGWWGTPPGSPLANLPDGLGSTLIPSFTTSAPDDWSVVGEMVGWLRSRGLEVTINRTSDYVEAEVWHKDWVEIIYSDHCASPGHAVAQVLLQVAEREAES